MRLSHFANLRGLCCFILASVPSILLGQQPVCSESKTEIQNLLAEVRQLRLAVERSGSLMPRMQLVLTRFQIQQERVDRIDGELKGHRMMMKSNMANKEMTAAQLKELEAQPAYTDPAQRREMESTKKGLAIQLEELGRREQEERTQDLELATQLQAEQAKLSDLSDQLNGLDKKLREGQ